MDYEFNFLSTLVSLELSSVKSGKKHISEIAQLSTIDTSNLSSSLFHDAQEAFLLNPMSSVLFLLPFSSQTIEFVSSVYLKGYLEYRRGNYLKVLSTCSMVEAPIHSFVNSLLGSSEFALGHLDKALCHYSCIKGGSLFQQGQTHKILGLIYISKKQYQYAIYHLSEAARLLPNHPSIWFYYSLSLLGTSKHDRYGYTLFTLQKCLDVSKSCDIEWKYWVHLLRVSIFDENRKKAAFHDGRTGAWQIRTGVEEAFLKRTGECQRKDVYVDLWKTFFETLNLTHPNMFKITIIPVLN